MFCKCDTPRIPVQFPENITTVIRKGDDVLRNG